MITFRFFYFRLRRLFAQANASIDDFLNRFVIGEVLPQRVRLAFAVPLLFRNYQSFKCYGHEESFINALHKVLNKDKSTIEAFIRGMLQVITADGTIHEKERAFLVRIINLLEHDGFEISLPA